MKRVVTKRLHPDDPDPNIIKVIKTKKRRPSKTPKYAKKYNKIQAKKGSNSRSAKNFRKKMKKKGYVWVKPHTVKGHKRKK